MNSNSKARVRAGDKSGTNINSQALSNPFGIVIRLHNNDDVLPDGFRADGRAIKTK
jgi:hypothetical protein